MKLKSFVIWGIAFLVIFAPSARAEEDQFAPGDEAPAEELLTDPFGSDAVTAESDAIIDSQIQEDLTGVAIEEARQLRKQGNYLEAQKKYEALLEGTLSDSERSELTAEYEKLNRKMLFSKYQTPDSVNYEVVPGDSLYKIAAKNKTSIGLIKKANGLKNDTIFAGGKLKLTPGSFSVQVDKSENVLVLSFNGKPIKHYSVATGVNNGTPAGTFKITDKLENPTWYKTGAVVQPGDPENGLGTRWLGFDKKGYGIHGTIEPETIGQQVTSGCVRMHNKEVEELFALVPSGTAVTIVD